MSITDQDRRILWGRAGGRCSICKTQLVTRGTDAADRPPVIGQEAHIISEALNGPRHEYLPNYDVYENLILLCGNNHKGRPSGHAGRPGASPFAGKASRPRPPPRRRTPAKQSPLLQLDQAAD